MTLGKWYTVYKYLSFRFGLKEKGKISVQAHTLFYTLRAESPSIFLDKSSSQLIQEDQRRLCLQGNTFIKHHMFQLYSYYLSVKKV